MLEGPGLVASVAIATFCNLTNESKKEAFKAYRDEEIDQLYGDAAQDESASARDTTTKKHTPRQRKTLNSG